MSDRRLSTLRPQGRAAIAVIVTLAQQVGHELRALRLRRGLTLREVAPRAGVTYAYVSDVETGRANVTLGTLVEIAAACGGEVALAIREQGAPTIESIITSLPSDRLRRVVRIAQLAPRVSLDLLDGVIVGLEAAAGR